MLYFVEFLNLIEHDDALDEEQISNQIKAKVNRYGQRKSEMNILGQTA